MAYKKQKGGPKMYRKDGALPMKSPMKRYNNMKSYSKPEDAVQFGDGIKMHGEHDGPKMYGKHDGPKMEKPPTYMKSGFKMKSGSPFQRNFGIGASPVKAAKPDYIDIDGDGNTTESMKQAASDKKAGGPQMQSPMKNIGVYESILDKETGEKTTTQVSRDRIKDITAQRNELQKQIAELEKSKKVYGPDGQKTPEYMELESQLADVRSQDDRITTTGKDAGLEVSEMDLKEHNKRLIADGEKPITKSQYANTSGNIKEEGNIGVGMIQELEKDKSGRKSTTHFDVDEETQLIDEDMLYKATPGYSQHADQTKRTKPAISGQILDKIQDKIDAGTPLDPDEKVLQETYIDILGAGGNALSGTATYQPGATPNTGGKGGYGFNEEGFSTDKDGNIDGGGYVATDEIDDDGDFKYEPATTENVNLYPNKDGKMVPLEDLSPARRGKLFAEQKKEETYIDMDNKKEEERKRLAQEKLDLFNSPESKQARSDYYDKEPDASTMNKRQYKRAMEQWEMEGRDMAKQGLL